MEKRRSEIHNSASRPPRIIILVYRATELVRYKITMRDGEDSTKMSTRTACRGA